MKSNQGMVARAIGMALAMASGGTDLGKYVGQTIKEANPFKRKRMARKSYRYKYRSKYNPGIQGPQECARRVRQMKKGMLDYGNRK